MPIDFTTGGASVSIANVVDTLVPGATAGSYVATLPDAFPVGAMVRTIGMQSYFQQVIDGSNVARHTPSPVMGVEGDTQRRAIGNMAECLSCHESLELHGGNRMDNPQICVMCHIPNLSSSGRTLDPANTNDGVEALCGPDPLDCPEATNNFKDMVHGIHAADVRSTPYEFVRVRGGNGYPFDWSHVTFPGNPANCTKCHLGDSYGTDVPEGLLLSTDVTTDGTNATREDVIAARAAMPNDTDEVITPISAACTACHDTSMAQAHMGQNGGAVNVVRSMANDGQTFETCELCHGSDRLADVEIMHGLE